MVTTSLPIVRSTMYFNVSSLSVLQTALYGTDPGNSKTPQNIVEKNK